LETFGPAGLGLRVEGLSLHDLHPPPEVVAAYHQVTRAMERRDRPVTDAEADRPRNRPRQEAGVLAALRAAEADRFEKITLAKARTTRMLALVRARSRLSAAEEKELRDRLTRAVAGGLTKAQAAKMIEELRAERIALQQTVTDFR